MSPAPVLSLCKRCAGCRNEARSRTGWWAHVRMSTNGCVSLVCVIRIMAISGRAWRRAGPRLLRCVVLQANVWGGVLPPPGRHDTPRLEHIHVIMTVLGQQTGSWTVHCSVLVHYCVCMSSPWLHAWAAAAWRCGNLFDSLVTSRLACVMMLVMMLRMLRMMRHPWLCASMELGRLQHRTAAPNAVFFVGATQAFHER